MNVILIEFASTLACRNNKPESASALIALPSEVELNCKGKCPQNPGRTKRFFPTDTSTNSWDKWYLQKASSGLKQLRSILFQEERHLWCRGVCWPSGMFSLSVRTSRLFQVPAMSQHSTFVPSTSLALRRPLPSSYTSHSAAQVLSNTLFCFWMIGIQAADRIHQSPPLSRNKTVSEQLVSHCYAAQPFPVEVFKEAESHKGHFWMAEAGISKGIYGHQAFNSNWKLM